MSVGTLDKTSLPINLGRDLDIQIQSLTINGDLTCNGTINGEHSQGQADNNTWTGLNEWDGYRPEQTSQFLNNGAGDGGAVRVSDFNKIVNTQSVLGLDNTFTGVAAFNGDVNYINPNTGGGLVTTTPQDLMTHQEVTDEASVITTDVLGTSNTWTGENTFQNYLPTTIDPVAGDDIATKKYVDDTTASGVSGLSKSSKYQGSSTMYISQANLNGSKSFNCWLTGSGGGGSPGSGGQYGTKGVGGASGGGARCFILGGALGAGSGVPNVSLKITMPGGGGPGYGCGVGWGGGNGLTGLLQIDETNIGGSAITLLNPTGGKGGTTYENNYTCYCGIQNCNVGAGTWTAGANSKIVKIANGFQGGNGNVNKTGTSYWGIDNFGQGGAGGGGDGKAYAGAGAGFSITATA